MIIISQDNEPLRLLAHHTVVFPIYEVLADQKQV